MKYFYLIIFIIIPILTFSQSKTANDTIVRGQNLFNQKCRACHDLDHNIIGTPLRNIHLKHTDLWLYKWIKSSTKLIESGDSAAVNIFKKYYQIVDPDSDLKDEEINEIILYLKSTAKN